MTESAPATLLVVGRLAESAEDQLGDVLNRLAMRRGPVRVVAFDLEAAGASSLDGHPDEVLAWLREEYDPTLVVVVEDADEVALGPRAPVPVSVRTGRAAAIAALRAWAEDDAEQQPLVGDAPHLLSALRSALPTPGVTSAHDRNPRASMIITVFNQEPYLHQTIRSTLANDYDDFELVLVDDGSTDASASIMDQYAGDPRVRIVSQANIGHTGRMDLAVNRGVSAARGELFAFLGGDDVNLPHRLSQQVAAFDADPGLGICHSASWIIDPAGTRLGHGISLHTPYDDFSFLRLMAQGNLVGHPTAMISRRTMEQVGPYEDGIASDCHYWFKSAGRVRFRYLPQRLVEYRLHGQSLSTTTEGQQRCALSAFRSRRIVLSRRSLADFYPELVDVGAPQAWTEAAMQLGNIMLQWDPVLALQIYDEALQVRRDPRLSHNRAVALLGIGDRSGALQAALPAAGLLRESAILVNGLRSNATFDVALLASDLHLTEAITRGRRVHGVRARNWDGSPVTTRSAYVAVDPESFLRVDDVLHDWSRLVHDQRDLRWVYPDLGLTESKDHSRLRAAGLSIETVDDLVALPPDEQRMTMVLRTEDDAAAFRRWMAAA